MAFVLRLSFLFYTLHAYTGNTSNNSQSITYQGTIKCGDIFNGTLESKSDIDYFLFHSLNTTNNVLFDSCKSSYDTYLYLHTNDSNLSVIAQGDDDGDCFWKEQLSVTLVTGWYILGISGHGSKENHRTGDWTIEVYCKPIDVSTEIIECNDKINGTLNSESDIDYYQFYLTDDHGTSKVIFELIHSSYDARLSLYDSNFTLIKERYDFGLIIKSLYPSQYILMISGDGTNNFFHEFGSWSIEIVCHPIGPAKIIYVNASNELHVNNQTGVSWETAFTSLKHAIVVSHDNDTIIIAPGVIYGLYLIEDVDNLKIYGSSYYYNESIATRTDALHQKTMLSGNYSRPIFYIRWATNLILSDLFIVNVNISLMSAIWLVDCNNVIIQNMKFENNTPTGSSYGGALLVLSSSNITIDNVYFNSNTARYGGALSLYFSADIIINNSIFDNNTAIPGTSIFLSVAIEYAGYGGGLYTSYTDNITIYNTQFIDNTALGKYGGAVYFTSSDNISIYNTKFNNNFALSTGCAICELFSDYMSIINVQFIGNLCGLYGGALKLWYSDKTIINNVEFNNNQGPIDCAGLSIDGSDEIIIINTQFINNSAGYSGAGINCRYSRNVSVNNTQFIYNIAGRGNRGEGACFFCVGSKNVSINNSLFSFNYAFNTGGVLFIQNVYDLLINNTKFVNNSASLIGGVLYAENIYNSTVENADFWYNKAHSGAVIWITSGSNITIKQSFFYQNQVSTIAAVLYGGRKASNLNLINCTITKNEAKYGQIYITTDILMDQLLCFQNNGGCIHFETGFDNASLNVVNSKFDDNIAHISGGAINIVATNKLSYMIENTSFQGNNAQVGGAIAISHNIKSCKNTSPMIINSNFTNNTAAIGGAIRMISSCSSIEMIGLIFQHNSAQNGGAVHIGSKIQIQTVTNTIFENNIALYNGGGVFILQSNNLFMNGCNMSLNFAGAHGGAIYLSPSHSMLHLSKCDLSENNSATHGGAIYINGTNQTPIMTLIIESSTFVGNKASTDGGCLYLNSVECSIIDSIFKSNIANNYGGCMFIKEETFVSVFETHFTDCHSTSIGGAVYSTTNSIEMDDCFFDSNVASVGGSIYLDQCPIKNYTSNNLTFEHNEAMFNGGGMSINDQKCNWWCQGCVYLNNTAAVGNDVSSPYPDLKKTNISFHLPDIVNQTTLLNLSISIFDEYNQLMKKTSYPISVIITLNESYLSLRGTYEQTIVNGHAKLSFNIESNPNIQSNDISFNATLELMIITPVSNLIHTYHVIFDNEIYKPPYWVHTQSYIMIAFVFINSVMIVKHLIKYRNNDIIKNGIPLYL
eukprot:69847_1